MVDRRGNAPRLSACKAEVLLLPLPAQKLDAFCITIVFAIPPHLANWSRWQDLNLQEHYTQLFLLAYIAVSIYWQGVGESNSSILRDREVS